MSKRRTSAHSTTHTRAASRTNGTAVPFLLGAAVGGVAGAVVGTLLSGHAAHLFATLVDVADRRGLARDRARPKFEYLQQ